jgi:hypothetical protein
VVEQPEELWAAGPGAVMASAVAQATAKAGAPEAVRSVRPLEEPWAAEASGAGTATAAATALATEPVVASAVGLVGATAQAAA